LTGEFDGGCNPGLNQKIADAMPHSDLVIMPGLKHAILIEASDLVSPHLKTFLEKTGS
jgi:pimeloyl-ACP methyl ester carboxylesterase